MSQKGQYIRWSSTGDEATKLKELFALFQATDGKAGVDPDLYSPSQIRLQVYDAYVDDFKKINRNNFPNNFRKVAADWKIDHHVTTGRKGK